MLNRLCPADEQLDRGVGIQRMRIVRRGKLQWRHVVHLFSGDSQRCAAGGEDGQARCSRD